MSNEKTPREERRETLADNFPSNSKSDRQPRPESEAPETKKLEKIITGEVKKQKKSFSKRIAEVFLEDDTKSVGSYILHDVLIPAAKSMISDMVGGGLDMLLFGERRGKNNSSIRRDGGRTYTSYGSFYSGGGQTRDSRPQQREMSRGGRARHDFDEIVLEARGDAEDVLSRLVDNVIDYGQTTVADLYDLVGMTGQFTDHKYGWTDLRNAYVSRVRGGYLINLPRPQPLD